MLLCSEPRLHLSRQLLLKLAVSASTLEIFKKKQRKKKKEKTANVFEPGFIGGGYDFTSSSAQLAVLDSELTRARELLNLPLENDQDKTASLPLGVGFLTFNASPDSEGLMELLHRHRPKGVWLFAPSNRRQHTALIAELKAVGESWDLKVFVQVGSVQSAIEAAQDGADILVVQGSDAGGHQFAAASSIITLVPEVSDMLREHGFKLPILAAGGIMDGRGMAAALALGEYHPQMDLWSWSSALTVYRGEWGRHGDKGMKFFTFPDDGSFSNSEGIVHRNERGVCARSSQRHHDIHQGRRSIHGQVITYPCFPPLGIVS